MSNLDKTTSSTAQQQKGLLERFSDLFWRIICLLANFPAFSYLKTFGLGDKTRILKSAVAMVIPPAVLTFSLIHYGPILLSEGYSHIILVLPVIVFICAWQIIANSWS